MRTSVWMRVVRHPKFTIALTILGVVLCCSGLLLLASYATTTALASLKRGDFSQASQTAARAKPIVTTANFLSAGLVPDIVVWQATLDIPLELQHLVEAVTDITHSALAPTDGAVPNIGLRDLLPHVSNLQQTLSTIHTKLPHTFFLEKSVSSKNSQLLKQATQLLSDVDEALQELSEGQQTWVVILQNSEELRATGGFPGSYVLVNSTDGRLTEMVVEDIYDADGQFKGHISAPPGIKEYTSGERGLRLPDANWWPDFPTSAQTMLQFFALGDKQHIGGLIALNLDAAQSVLHITGPLWLPDYNVEVNEQNVGEILRAERTEFFPGSSQKKHLVSLTLTVLKQRITELSIDQKYQLAQALYKNIKQKNIQFYSTDPALQSLFSTYSIAGEINAQSAAWQRDAEQCSCQPVIIALSESNVGINKVNRYVTRASKIEFSPQKLAVTTTFINHASPMTSTELSKALSQPAETQPRNGNGYLNYYRLLISPEYTIDSVSLGDSPIQSWDDEVIQTASGTEVRQIGVLVPVPEKHSVSVTFSLKTASTEIPTAVELVKQSGLPSTTYTLAVPKKSTEFQLETDQFITL